MAWFFIASFPVVGMATVSGENKPAGAIRQMNSSCRRDCNHDGKGESEKPAGSTGGFGQEEPTIATGWSAQRQVARNTRKEDYF